MSIDSENSLFKQILPDEIPNLIECSPFNKRRGKLFLFSEEGRTKLASHFFEFENYFIVDSMPLEICKFSRHNRNKLPRGRAHEVLVEKYFFIRSRASRN